MTIDHDEALRIAKLVLDKNYTVQRDIRKIARAYRDLAEWRPISEAPRDRRIILAKIVGHPEHPTSFWWAVVGAWSEKWGNWNDGVEPSGLAGPTHWKEIGPLPPLPKVTL